MRSFKVASDLLLVVAVVLVVLAIVQAIKALLLLALAALVLSVAFTVAKRKRVRRRKDAQRSQT